MRRGGMLLLQLAFLCVAFGSVQAQGYEWWAMARIMIDSGTHKNLGIRLLHYVMKMHQTSQEKCFTLVISKWHLHGC